MPTRKRSYSVMKGVSDIIALIGGKMICIEVKTPKGKQSPHQVEFQKNIESNGGYYFTVISIENLCDNLRNILYYA